VTKILMVCLANICRSPMAEGLLESKLTDKTIQVDSAGTGGYFIDTPPDERAITVAASHDLDISQKCSRIFTIHDFDDFNIIYVMDKINFNNVMNLAKSEQDKAKVILILNEIFPGQDLEVPDPYTGGMNGFRNVYQILDEACEAIAKKHNSQN